MSQEELVQSPDEQPVRLVTSRGGSNKQAFKVAGLTVLATVLLAGQVFTAYTVYQHSEKLGMLERRSDRLQEITRRASSNRTPMKLAMPMNSLPMLVTDFTDEKAKSTPPKEATLTQCQKLATGLLPSSLPSFRPECDENGAFKPEQCWQDSSVCWCVDENGTPLPNSQSQGHAQCKPQAAKK